MNWKRFAIKFADLKDQTTYNQIKKVFSYLVDFDVHEFTDPWFTSTKAKLIYDRTLTISESSLDEKNKRQNLKDAIDDLLVIETDRKLLKDILDEWEEKFEEKIVIKEVIKYIEKEHDFEVEALLESYLPIKFFDEIDPVLKISKNDEFKNHILDSYKKNKTLWNNQFSYIAYYMLFVSYLYKITWELKTIWDSWIITNINTFIQTQLSWNDVDLIFDLSWIWEDIFCRNVNNFIRCLHKNEIDEIVNFVQKRNHCAHPSWIIQYNKSEVENLILKINIYTEKIQKKINIQLSNYIKNNLYKILFDQNLILSENEILFLLSEKDEILNFNSDSDENIRKKMNFLNLIYNNYTEKINFEEWKIYELFLELFKWYDKNFALYSYLEELILHIKSFSKEQDKNLIEIIKEIWLNSTEWEWEYITKDLDECISFIENI